MLASGTSVGQFRAGPCHQVAAPVLDVANAAAAVAGGQTTAQAAEGRLSTDQGQLAAAVGTLAGGLVVGQVRTLVTDLGLFRFTVDHHTYNGSQLQAVARDAAGIDSGCVAGP